LVIILMLGLWPLRVPKNTASWLRDRPGLLFQRYGTAIMREDFSTPRSATLEIWLKPTRAFDRHTFLGFGTTEHPHLLLMRQNGSDLEVDIESGGHLFPKMTELEVRGVFEGAKTLVLTLTTDAQKSLIYVDGAVVQTARVPFVMGGRLVVGDSPGQQDSWRGEVYGLAIFARQLAPSEVARHYDTWTQNKGPEIGVEDQPVALYSFDERAGNVVHNKAGRSFDLFLPKDYTVAHQFFLEPFWREFKPSPPYWRDLSKNVIGFIPLGLCLYPLLASFGVRRAMLATVAVGAAISLGMELIQATLPSRESGTTDLLANSAGTWIGVGMYRFLRPTLALTGSRWLRIGRIFGVPTVYGAPTKTKPS
jgi:VanZ family protein